MMKLAKNDHSRHHDGFTNKITATKNRFGFIYMAIAGVLLIALLVTASQLFTTAVSANAGSRVFNSLFAPAAGTVTIKSGNYLGASTTQTATFTKQIFSSGDCTTGGGSIDTVAGVDSITGHSFALGAGTSVQVTIPNSGIYFQYVSEQNGPFVALRATDIAYFNSVIYSGDGHQVCIQGFDGVDTRTYNAEYYGGIELFDECGNERYDFRPGETMTIKVSGGLKPSGEALRLMVAGGGVNECTFLPTGPAFTTVHVTSDPFTFELTLPASDAEIPSFCSVNPTTTILGQWRTILYDSGCGCNRNDLKFNVANDAVQPGCDDGTLTIKSSNYLGASTTQTARFTKQTYSSSDCTGAAGPLETVTGVDSITGHTFTLGAGNSVQVTIPGGGSPYEYQSEQRGPFVSWAAADNSYFDSVIYSGDGHQVCIQGFDGVSPRTYLARYYAGIQMYDACGHELYSYRPGETVTFKVSGGLTLSALPLKLLAAGGSVNECTWLPAGSDPLVEITSDPFIYNFTFPDSNDDIPAHCLSSNSTSILGNWRVVALDQSCGCNRTETRYTLAEDAPQPTCADGLINIKSGNYLGGTTTQTATFTKQVFSSANCTSGGGSIETLTGVDSLTGTSFSLPAGDSVQVTIPPSGLYFQYVSEQNGPFVAWQAEDNAYFNSVIYSGDGHQVCIQGFTGSETRTYRAQFYPGIEMFDTCDNERYDFRPGETVKLKITGGLKPGGAPMRLLVAGGGVNECTFVPEGPSFTTVTIDADPFYYEFTLPASNADIPSHCASSPTTDILGQWRAVIFDPGLGGNRNDLKFNLSLDAPQPGCAMACPGDITVSNDPGSCGAVVNYTAPTTPPTVTCNYPSGSTFPVGTTQVTCTSTAGPSCSFNVTVNDTEDPTITAPADLMVNTDSTSCVATGVSLGPPTTGDNCAVFSVANDAPLAFPPGPTTVTWTVTDTHGRTATDTQVITVVDNTPPAISCPADMNVDFNAGVGGATVTYAAPAGQDNCPAATSQIAGLPSGSVFPLGTTTNTFRVTAGAGSAQCSFKVTVALTSLVGLNSTSITGAGYADSYSSAGGYPATKGSLANLLSNGTMTFSNSGKLWGNARSTQAGISMSGASQITGNATAGTTVSKSGGATVGGTTTNNAPAPAIVLPAVSACSPFSSNSGISGTYSYNAATGDLTLSGANIATLANGSYCFRNVTLTNSAQLRVNGPVVIRLTGKLDAGGATRVNNTTNIPSNLRVLSSYSGTSGVNVTNSSNVVLVLYAPNTNASLSGTTQLFGTVAAKTITIANSGAIHYDTTLKSIWPELWALIGP